jgi:hypothetical protein
VSDRRWLDIPGFDRYQHPDTARGLLPPPWIKVYTHLLDDDAYRDLTVARRAMFLGLLLEYAQARRSLRADTRQLSRRLDQRVRQEDLEALSAAGLITLVASKPQADRLHDARLEGEGEGEGPPYPREAGEPLQADPVRDNGAGELPDGHVRCLRCSTPTRIGYRCPGCGASPRAAGSNARDHGRQPTTTAYERAETLTRNGAWQYDLEAFRDELDHFDLTAAERGQLEQLRAELVDDDEALSW